MTGPVNNGDQLGGLKRPLLFVVQVLGAVPENDGIQEIPILYFLNTRGRRPRTPGVSVSSQRDRKGKSSRPRMAAPATTHGSDSRRKRVSRNSVAASTGTLG